MATRSQKEGQEKARYACFIVYPESAPKNWREQLKASHGSFAISPLHGGDEEEQKDHHHCIYMHGGPATIAVMKRAIPEGIAANGHVELCLHPRNYQRYLLHLDDPDKQQWRGDPRELIDLINGFPLDLTRDFSKQERVQQRNDLIAIIRNNGLCEYADLLEGLVDSGLYDLLDYAANHTILFQAYLSSRRNRGGAPEDDEENPDETNAD